MSAKSNTRRAGGAGNGANTGAGAGAGAIDSYVDDLVSDHIGGLSHDDGGDGLLFDEAAQRRLAAYLDSVDDSFGALRDPQHSANASPGAPATATSSTGAAAASASSSSASSSSAGAKGSGRPNSARGSGASTIRTAGGGAVPMSARGGSGADGSSDLEAGLMNGSGDGRMSNALIGHGLRGDDLLDGDDDAVSDPDDFDDANGVGHRRGGGGGRSNAFGVTCVEVCGVQFTGRMLFAGVMLIVLIVFILTSLG